ncbi:MAG: VOC family protein [Acidimicrobiales bacterium]|nr:VOC family protein [Acidimicrobiales bacterium]MCB9392513.1 VOC family protein [Acidimicrobiaceae bacterium]
MTLTVGHITFDCHDAAALAGFWSAALGRPVDDGAQPFFASIGYPAAPGQPAWLFLGVPEGKSAKNRMHLDLVADAASGGREAEVDRLVALGATRLGDHDEWGHRWTVMCDPEGNEFCVA